MKRKLLNLLLVILLVLAIPGAMVLASDVTGAIYKMGITVSNNGTLANYVSTTGNISTPNLIAGNYSNAAVDNVAVQDAGSNDVIFMPGHTTNPWCFWVETIGADSYINYNLYTADSTGGTIAYFPDTTGMIVSDNSTLELGNDFEIEQSGYVDTDAGADKNLVFKDDAFRTYISAEDEITSAIMYGANEFPVVEAVNGGNDVVNQNNHTVNLPAGIVAGDLLIVLFVSDGNTAINFPNEGTDWIQLFEDHDGTGVVTFAAAYRIADGGEGANITVVTNIAEMTAHTSYRISGYSEVPEAGVSVGATNVNPDPPNLTPSWGSANTLWLAVEGNDDQDAVTDYPANYTDGRNDVAANADGCGVGSARRELRAVSENPGTFTIAGAEQWVANTIAIAPAELEATATGIASDEYTVKTYGVANEPAWATGDVLHFTGAADSNVNCGAIHNLATKLWVSFWFKLDSAFSSASGTHQYLYGKILDVNNRIYTRLDESNGLLVFWLNTLGVTRFFFAAVPNSWNADQWYHVIASISSATGARLIVDGATPVTDADTTAIFNGGDFIVGDWDDPGAGTGFIGEIQNVIVGTDDLTLLLTGTNTDLIATNLVTQDVSGATGYVVDVATTWITVARTNNIAFVDGQNVVEDGDAADLLTGTILSTDEEANLYAGIAPGDETNYWYIDEGVGTGVDIVRDYGSAPSHGDVDAACFWETATYTTGETGRLCDFYIEVDDGVTDADRWGANLKGASVADNANDWEFFLNDCMPYVKSLDITVSGVTHGSYDLTKYLPTSTLIDRSYYGLSFDGVNDQVTIPTDPSLHPAGSLTVEMWASYTNTNWTYLLWGRSGAGGNEGYYVQDNNGKLWWYVKCSDGITANASFNGGYNDGVYRHIVCVRDIVTDELYLYVNGIEVNNGTDTTTGTIVHANDLDFGLNDVQWYEGQMDEMRIYNRALSLTEIQYNYNGGASRYTPYSIEGLVGWWHAEEGSGVNLTDSSGEGNDGTLENGVAWVNGQVPRPVDSSGTNDGTASFRTTSSDADVIATAVNFVPIEEAQAPAWTLDTTVATWVTAPTITGNFTTTPGPTYPGASVISDIAAASGTPAQLPFTILFAFLVLALSLVVTYLMRQSLASSLLVKFLVIAFAMWIGIVLNVVDFWMLLFFIFPAIAILAASKQGSLI